MSTSVRLRQVWTIASLQLRRVFFSRRSLWVYILALFPSVVFLGRGVEVVVTRQTLSGSITAPADLATDREGDTPEQVLALLGEPLGDRTTPRRGRSVTVASAPSGVT